MPFHFRIWLLQFILHVTMQTTERSFQITGQVNPANEILGLNFLCVCLWWLLARYRWKRLASWIVNFLLTQKESIDQRQEESTGQLGILSTQIGIHLFCLTRSVALGWWHLLNRRVELSSHRNRTGGITMSFMDLQFILALFFVLGQDASQVECSIRSKIIGGWHVSIKDAPYYVAVAHWDTENYIKGWIYRCGGSIVNIRWVVTAGRCLVRFGTPMDEPAKVMVPWDDVAIVLGRSHRNYSKQWLDKPFSRIRKVVIHPSFAYNSTHATNDIALLRILRSRFYWMSTVQPVILASRDYQPVKYSPACVAGLGLVDPSKEKYDLWLKAVCSDTASNRDCISAFTGEIRDPPLPTEFVCLPPLDSWAHSRMCHGDAGSGLAKKLANGSFLLLGVSLGANDEGCLGGGLEKFSNIAYFQDWINSIIVNLDDWNISFIINHSQRCKYTVCNIITNKLVWRDRVTR